MPVRICAITVTFDRTAFAVDVIQMRTDLEEDRHTFAKRFSVSDSIIRDIENQNITPKLELCYNICLFMDKDITIYFKKL